MTVAELINLLREVKDQGVPVWGFIQTKGRGHRIHAPVSDVSFVAGSKEAPRRAVIVCGEDIPD